MVLMVKFVNHLFPNNPFWAGKEAIKDLQRRSSICIQSYETLSSNIQQEVDTNHFSKFLIYEHTHRDA